MEWCIDERLPIWSQLVEQLCAFITSGGFEPGQRLPSVRDFAQEAGVNPNTMQRALSELETRGLVVTNRTAGRCVTSDMERIAVIRRGQMEKQVADFIGKMEALGFTKEEIFTAVRDALRGGDGQKAIGESAAPAADSRDCETDCGHSPSASEAVGKEALEV